MLIAFPENQVKLTLSTIHQYRLEIRLTGAVARSVQLDIRSCDRPLSHHPSNMQISTSQVDPNKS